jgi:hypothetical protein
MLDFFYEQVKSNQSERLPKKILVPYLSTEMYKIAIHWFLTMNQYAYIYD